MPSASSGQSFFMRALSAGARQDQAGVDEAGLGGAIDGGGLDVDRVRLLQAAEADDQLVELRLLPAARGCRCRRWASGR